MMRYGYHYLDTSALVKLLLYPDIKELGSDELASYHKNNFGFYTLDLCIAEALNVLKIMYFSTNQQRKQLNQNGYLICIHRLSCWTKPKHTLHVKTTDISDNKTFLDAYDIVKKYDIDFVDAILVQHVAARQVKSLLISSDGKMCRAARKLNIDVWNCAKEQAPSCAK